jgi:hypothetical protein
MSDDGDTVTEEILMKQEISFHDDAFMTVSVTRYAGEMHNISLEVFTAVHITIELCASEAAELSGALAAAVKACAARPDRGRRIA